MRWIFDLEAWKTNTTAAAKRWVSNQFPKKHYGEEILTYEAWSLRALLEQAFMAGTESCSDLKLYKVKYWSEGPGRSGPVHVEVLAKSSKAAVALVNEKCGVYKADRDSTKVVANNSKEQVIRHVD